MGPNLKTFIELAKRAKSGAVRHATTIGRGSKRVWESSSPIGKGAILGGGAGFAYGATNLGRKYKAKDIPTRIRRGVSNIPIGAFSGAAIGGLHQIGRR